MGPHTHLRHRISLSGTPLPSLMSSGCLFCPCHSWRINAFAKEILYHTPLLLCVLRVLFKICDGVTDWLTYPCAHLLATLEAVKDLTNNQVFLHA